MIKHILIAAIGALTLSIGLADVAVAQSQDKVDEIQERNEREGRPNADQNRDPRARRGRQQATREPSAEENLAAAQAALTAMNASCTVTEAKLLGETAEKNRLYEAACSAGPGYVVQASTPPAGEDCLLLDSQARMARERDPAADVGTLCTLPANQNLNAILADYATRAGVACTVNEGMAIGRTSAGAILYEVGCENTDGYRLERTGEAVIKVPCLRLSSQGYACRFTTKDEQIADVQKLLAGTDAAGCTPIELRYMGSNANGEFIEAKCATDGQGFIVRVKDAMAQQVYPCATAQQVGGGCTLTTAAPAAPAASTEQ